MSLASIIFLLLSLFEVVHVSADPPTKQAKGDANNPIMDRETAYVANNAKFKRVCYLNGGVNGPPALEFKDEDGQPIVSMKPRLKVTIDKDTVTNKTTATFILDPANVDDNVFRQVSCRNIEPGRGTSSSFKLNVIPDISIPTIKINNGSKEEKVKNGDSAELTCSLSAIKHGVVKDYSIGWAIGDLDNLGERIMCVPKVNKNLKAINAMPGPIKVGNKMLTSVLTIKKADLRSDQTFFCVACMKVGKNTYFDAVKQYNDSIVVNAVPASSTPTTIQITTTNTTVVGKSKTKKEVKRTMGESVELDCMGIGIPPPKLTWWKKKYGDDEVLLSSGNVDKRYSFKSRKSEQKKQTSAANSVLKISGLTLDDRAKYRCVGIFRDQNVTKIWTLRVKDPNGVWWPIIGMVVEAVLLFLIILLCERFKAKKDPHMKKKGGRNQDVTDGHHTTSHTERDPLVNSGDAKMSNNEVPT